MSTKKQGPPIADQRPSGQYWHVEPNGSDPHHIERRKRPRKRERKRATRNPINFVRKIRGELRRWFCDLYGLSYPADKFKADPLILEHCGDLGMRDCRSDEGRHSIGVDAGLSYVDRERLDLRLVLPGDVPLDKFRQLQIERAARLDAERKRRAYQAKPRPKTRSAAILSVFANCAPATTAQIMAAVSGQPAFMYIDGKGFHRPLTGRSLRTAVLRELRKNPQLQHSNQSGPHGHEMVWKLTADEGQPAHVVTGGGHSDT